MPMIPKTAHLEWASISRKIWRLVTAIEVELALYGPEPALHLSHPARTLD